MTKLVGDYQRSLSREGAKWGRHLAVEASREWNAWLDHPLIREHYCERSLLDGLPWEAWVRRQLGRSARRSLDLGCGSGTRSLKVFQAGASEHVEGIDISEGRIAEAERCRREAQVPGRFEVADVNSIALPVGAYDLIFSCHSFHHFAQLEHIMAQVREALTPEGLFILEEYVGPTQFQWTDEQIALTQALLAMLPERLRTYRWGSPKEYEGRPSPEAVVAASPFEAIRSSQIRPFFQDAFEVVAVRALGGTIQHLLYNGIVHNFLTDDEEALRYVKGIGLIEDTLVDSGKLPSDFALLVGR